MLPSWGAATRSSKTLIRKVCIFQESQRMEGFQKPVPSSQGTGAKLDAVQFGHGQVIISSISVPDQNIPAGSLGCFCLISTIALLAADSSDTSCNRTRHVRSWHTEIQGLTADPTAFHSSSLPYITRLGQPRGFCGVSQGEQHHLQHSMQEEGTFGYHAISMPSAASGTSLLPWEPQHSHLPAP